MNPKHPSLVSSPRNLQARIRLLSFTASRVGKIAACLILLGVAMLSQTARSQTLVGQWFTNNSLADISGFTPAGTHDGYDIAGTGTYTFTNDVPPNKTGQSLWLYNGDTGIAIANSSTLDGSYTNTFDEGLTNAMTVAVWAKGWPGGWNPFVSKNGESAGWQLRQNGQNNQTACWTIRGAGGTVTLGTAVYGNAEDMAGTAVLGDTNIWHHYVGTYDAVTGDRKLYVDGQLDASAITNTVYNLSADSLCIGSRGFGNFFNGLIYDARVYNYALSASEILTIVGGLPAAISAQPRSISVFAGEQVKLSVAASGTPPISYQWRLNGTNVNLLPNSVNFTGANSNVLTILSQTTNEVGSYSVTVTNLYSTNTLISSNAVVTIGQPNLVGRWFNGSSSLADVSGYTPAGTHDGYPVGGGTYSFVSDVPAGLTGQSLDLTSGDTGIAITNSSMLDGGYLSTFDEVANSHITVTYWAKGAPGQWNPWVTKNGESAGWQFRIGEPNVDGNPVPCWTVRDNSAGNFALGAGPSWAMAGLQDDLHAAVSGAGASAVYFAVDPTIWHFYAGTFNAVSGVRNLYIDGVLRGQETNNVLYGLAKNSHVIIGGREDNNNQTIGNFSAFLAYDFRIYNYDLTANQILALMPGAVPSFNGPPILNGNNLILSWSSGTLLSATNVAGPYLAVAGATSPFTNDVTTAPQEFYRLSNP
jgi:hypothetical protein